MATYRSPIPAANGAMRGNLVPDHLRSGWKALEEERRRLVEEHGKAAERFEKADKKLRAARDAHDKAARAKADVYEKLERIQDAQATMDPHEKAWAEKRRQEARGVEA